MVHIPQRQGLCVLTLFATAPLLGLVAAHPEELTQERVQNIAIIGAGAAGSSAAYHLRRFAEDEGVPINVTIFESRGRAGGRTRTVNVYDDPLQPVEQGASIFVRVNTILYDAVQEFGLQLVKDDDGVEERLVIWDGETFRYEQNEGSSKWWNYAKLFWKYGMTPLKAKRLVDSTIGRFLELYDEPHFPFTSLTQAAIDLDLVKLTGITGGQFLQESGIGLDFSRDIIQAATRVNYATNLAHIHGLEAMVSMAPDGAMQVAGGNWQIFANMVRASNASFLYETAVTSLELQKSSTVDNAAPKYILSTKATGPRARGDSKAEPGSDAAGKAGFFSVSTLRRVKNPKTRQTEYLYKVFSPEVVDPDFLSRLLGVEVPSTFTGRGPTTDDEPISWYHPTCLTRNGLYYTSGIESFISTMETSALMGKNVAKLIVNELAGKDEALGGSQKGSSEDDASSSSPGPQDEL
ncbi:unnamed protein product [Parascedosporium putredinis]|uniref:Prenylcysteine lyase domain-containing protein n=1 Tax=Parascedosporium putredinis TaxID=1442378 RepID=A0A9P1H3G2_9PEZI|nr:unnamed protein product [Parascedosporium putredinis]CAI7994783.1 unnamed protein product [Parascedosporium putredinis]